MLAPSKTGATVSAADALAPGHAFRRSSHRAGDHPLKASFPHSRGVEPCRRTAACGSSPGWVGRSAYAPTGATFCAATPAVVGPLGRRGHTRRPSSRSCFARQAARGGACGPAPRRACVLGRNHPAQPLLDFELPQACFHRCPCSYPLGFDNTRPLVSGRGHGIGRSGTRRVRPCRAGASKLYVARVRARLVKPVDGRPGSLPQRSGRPNPSLEVDADGTNL